MKKPIRVWSQDRKRRHGVVAESFDEVIEKGAAKLGLPDPCAVTVVLEEDGTVVDDDYWETIAPDTRLILLSTNEVWKPSPLTVPSNLLFVSDETDGSLDEKQKASNLFAVLQQNPASVALLSLSDLEIIKEANLDAPELSKHNSESSMQLQELCIEFYVKKKKEAEAMELVDLLKEHLKGNDDE
ncbi:DNA fragmentation factor subunit alpha [Procambarus clarkii]|uniref:DNA fragmentation factor subunit alpha n=1 Tax=Procambarus clarkii TaxID=6728 RepID=UPI001E675713|nr:DNA fragmentation factor subunit alpha-like [Procambarus clarkii]